MSKCPEGGLALENGMALSAPSILQAVDALCFSLKIIVTQSSSADNGSCSGALPSFPVGIEAQVVTKSLGPGVKPLYCVMPPT